MRARQIHNCSIHIQSNYHPKIAAGECIYSRTNIVDFSEIEPSEEILAAQAEKRTREDRLYIALALAVIVFFFGQGLRWWLS